MKKSVFVAFIICLLITQTYAQGFIVQWQGGYGWQPGSTQPIPAQLFNSQTPTIDQWTNLANVNDPGNSSKSVNNSYGHGFNVNLLLGYMFNPYIGVTLGVNYQQSKTISASLVNNLYYPDSTGTPEPTGAYINSTITTQSKNLTLSPSIIIQYDKPKFKFYPYLRAGITLPVFTVIEQHAEMALAGASALIDSPYYLGAQTSVGLQTYTKFSVGFNGAIGLVYKAYPFLHLFVEVNAQYLNMKGDFSQVTEWMADGVDYSGNRGYYRDVYQYVKTLNGSSNNAAYNVNYNPNNAKQELSPNFPFSYIGFNLGVKLCLNKKIFKDQDKFEEERVIKSLKRAKKKKAAEPAPDTTTPTPATTPH